MIDLDFVSANWQVAQNHGRASKTGKPTSRTDLCPCCLTQIQRQQVSLCENVKQLDHLGFGVPLFYTFLKNCIMLLVILIASYSIISLMWAHQHSAKNCEKLKAQTTQDPHSLPLVNPHPHTNHLHQLIFNFKHMEEEQHQNHLQCKKIMVMEARVEKKVSFQQKVLRVVSFIIITILLIYLFDKLRTMHNYFDERTISLSDYSIMLSLNERVPEIQKKSKNFLNSAFKERHKVSEMIVLPMLEQVEELEKNKAKLQHERGKLYNDEHSKVQTYLRQTYSIQNEGYIERYLRKMEAYDAQILQNKKKLLQQCKSMEEEMANEKIIASRIIILFQTEDQKEEVIQQFHNMQKSITEAYFGHNIKVSIKEAPEAKEIIWENVNYTSKEVYFSYFISYAISILFLVAVTVIFFFILTKKTTIVEKYLQHGSSSNSKLLAVIISYGALFLVVLFNKFVMAPFLHFIGHHEKCQTSASREFSFALKYSFGMFFTTALMTVAVEAIQFKNYYTHQYGVIEQQSIMFVLTALFVPFIWLVNPFQLIRLIKRRLNKNSRVLSQREAHHLMEDFQYSIGKRYAEVLQIIWFTFLYSTLIPGGALFSVIGLFLYYWVDKYNLLRRSSLSINISGDLSYRISKLLNFSLLFKALGDFIFDYQLRNSVETITIVFLVIGLIFPFLPWVQILQQVQNDKFFNANQTYSEAKKSFVTDYRTFHPIYQNLGIQKNLTSKQINADQHNLRERLSQYCLMKKLLKQARISQ